MFQVGDRVEKIGGDYTFVGTVVSVFLTSSGATRIVVEMDRFGILFIAYEQAYRKEGSKP
jgi:hypothetical protein